MTVIDLNNPSAAFCFSIFMLIALMFSIMALISLLEIIKIGFSHATS